MDSSLFRRNANVNRSPMEVIKEMKLRASMGVNLNRKPNGEKCLVYFSINYNKDYIDLLLYNLQVMGRFKNRSYYDVLIICPEEYEKDIRELIKVRNIRLGCIELMFMHVPMAVDGVEASMNKLKIYKWSGLSDYGKILFVDADAIFLKAPCDVFDIQPVPGILHSTTYSKYKGLHQQPYFTLQLYSEQDINAMEARGIYAFNAGQYYFVNSEFMMHHFAVMDWLSKAWPGSYFFEQAIMNFYLNSFALSDVHLLYGKMQLISLPEFTVVPCNKGEVNLQDLILLHFAGFPTEGRKKLNSIRMYFNEPEEKNELNKSFRATDLIKINTRSEYSNDLAGRLNVLELTADKYRAADKLSKTVTGNKKLIYYTAFGDSGWFKILELSLNSLAKHYAFFADVLIITDEAGREIIKQFICYNELNISFMIMPPVTDGVGASMCKLKIYEYSNIKQYRYVLYLDCDIIVTKPLHELFYGCEKEDKLHVAYSTPTINKIEYEAFCKPFHSLPGTFDQNDLPRLKHHNQKPFNAGQFLFFPSDYMLENFRNVDWMTQAWPSSYFFEQSFMNYYFCNNLLTDSSVMNKHTCILHINLINEGSSGVNKAIAEINDAPSLIHFAGTCLMYANKLDFIEAWLNTDNANAYK